MSHLTTCRIVRPPHALRRRKIQLDNVALVPASLLPFKAQYQQAANELPPGGILIVLPPPPKRQRRICENVVAQLRAKGQRVGTVQQIDLAHGEIDKELRANAL